MVVYSRGYSKVHGQNFIQPFHFYGYTFLKTMANVTHFVEQIIIMVISKGIC